MGLTSRFTALLEFGRFASARRRRLGLGKPQGPHAPETGHLFVRIEPFDHPASGYLVADARQYFRAKDRVR